MISYKKKERKIGKLSTLFCSMNYFYHHKSQTSFLPQSLNICFLNFTTDSLSFLNSIEVTYIHTFPLCLYTFWFRLCDILLEFCQTWEKNLFWWQACKASSHLGRREWDKRTLKRPCGDIHHGNTGFEEFIGGIPN